MLIIAELHVICVLVLGLWGVFAALSAFPASTLGRLSHSGVCLPCHHDGQAWVLSYATSHRRCSDVIASGRAVCMPRSMQRPADVIPLAWWCCCMCGGSLIRAGIMVGATSTVGSLQS